MLVLVPISADRTSMGDIAVKEAEVRQEWSVAAVEGREGERSQGRSCYRTARIIQQYFYYSRQRAVGAARHQEDDGTQ